MKLEPIPGLAERLSSDAEVQFTGDGTYALDIFEVEPPITLELLPSPADIDVLAAAELLFSEELDGYYMGERLDDSALIARALHAYMEY